MLSPGCRPMLVLLCLAGASVPSTLAASFDKDIRPLLQARCLLCHSGDRPKGGLRLDTKAAAMKGGDAGPSLVPGKSAASTLIERVTSPDKSLRMPPRGEPLTAEQVALLRQWIDAGADWPANAVMFVAEPGWSLKPLVKPPLPSSTATASNPLDVFIDARLREKGLSRSPAADRRTLIRRLTFDLTGLPPSPEETAAFLADSTPNAYEKLVERLLASPRYGEHWARHWLDLAQYADTHGNDHDWYRPNAWPYRDYVIRAFNDDKPYARFVQEQVAGDVLFPHDPQATVALGFLAAGPWDHTLLSTIREDTVDHRMGRNLDRDNIVSTVMSTFTSLTVHCARCHDHKFDPISQREYYALQAVFAGVDRADRPYDAEPRTTARRLALLAQKKALAQRDPALLDASEAAVKVAAVVKSLAPSKEKWQLIDVSKVVSSAAPGGTIFTREADGSWFVSGTRPVQDTFTLTAQTSLQGVRALRLEVLPDKRLPHGGPGRYDNGNFHLSHFRVVARPLTGKDKAGVKLTFTRALADHSDAGDVVANALEGKPGKFWSIHPRYNEPHEAVFELKEPLGFAEGTALTIELDFKGTTGHQIGRFRLWATTESLPATFQASKTTLSPALLALLRIPVEKQTPEQRRELTLQILSREVERELATLPAPQLVYAATRDFAPSGSFKPSPKPRPIYLLKRGEIDKHGELVSPGTVGCVPRLPGTLEIASVEEEAQRRAALARWLTDERNVLTWRSIVNRVWHYHFGRGLCDSPSDFGKMGGTPSHPELLDWLAVWFREDAQGSLKALHRLLVTSATYQQTSGASAKGTAVDADNRLLWRMQRTRLTAEMVRDSALQISGRLNRNMGGPAVVQFKHKGIENTFMPTSGAPPFLDYERFDPDAPENNRRAIYRFLFRTVPDPLLETFDCPDGGAVTPVRGTAATATQALAMLNNAFLLRQTEHLAVRIARDESEPTAQVGAAFQLLLQRAPTERERSVLTAYIRRHGLANACHVLLNSNEFLYLD